MSQIFKQVNSHVSLIMHVTMQWQSKQVYETESYANKILFGFTNFSDIPLADRSVYWAVNFDLHDRTYEACNDWL